LVHDRSLNRHDMTSPSAIQRDSSLRRRMMDHLTSHQATHGRDDFHVPSEHGIRLLQLVRKKDAVRRTKLEEARKKNPRPSHLTGVPIFVGSRLPDTVGIESFCPQSGPFVVKSRGDSSPQHYTYNDLIFIHPMGNIHRPQRLLRPEESVLDYLRRRRILHKCLSLHDIVQISKVPGFFAGPLACKTLVGWRTPAMLEGRVQVATVSLVDLVWTRKTHFAWVPVTASWLRKCPVPLFA